MVAAMVAISEGLLYLIWQARMDKSSQRGVLRAQRRGKKGDSGGEDNADEKVALSVSDGLRRRQVLHTNE